VSGVSEVDYNSDMAKRTSTPETGEGPYYKQGSPEESVLFREGILGEQLDLTGFVRDVNGKALPGAWLDFWQANGNGKYDNSGYTLRGHQITGRLGQYHLKTVVPGSYPGRTPHIHVKLRKADAGRTYTTQLFFPGLASNREDFIFREDLLISVSSMPQGKTGVFDFVLDAT
jgi:protocatechuate 3,4-dioxygenase beta subunit